MKLASKKDKIKQAQTAARAALSQPNADHVSPVGSLVLYDPNTGWTRDAGDVRNEFRANGLDPDVLLPVSPDYETAFSRAILATRTAIQGRGYTLLQAGAGPNGESRYSVVAVARNGTVTTADHATVFCPKDGCAPYVERTSYHADADDIATMIVNAAKERFGTYTSDDVRQAVLKTLDLYAAVPVRNSRPFLVYWIAQAGAEALHHLSQVLTSLGWGEIQAFEGRLTEANIEFATKAVNSTLDEQLNEFAAEADTYAANADHTRPSTIERRIEEAKAIKAKAELYRALLGAAVESVDDRLRAVETSLIATLGVIDACAA